MTTPSREDAQTPRKRAWPGVPEARRTIMRANRRRDTTPELALRSALHARGLRFRVDYPIRGAGRRPIRPDIVFTRTKVAIFVDGCFWHGCPEHATHPKTNADYWGPKLSENIARDARTTRALEDDGWTVVRIWEHESTESAMEMVTAVL